MTKVIEERNCPMCGKSEFLFPVDGGQWCETYKGGCGLGISTHDYTRPGEELPRFWWKGEDYSKEDFERFLKLRSFE